jgi:GntR family transcriptional regulator, transcriptional repressor for pyruvate dehydrogenase complex
MVNKTKTLVACIEALEGPLRASRLRSISGHLARIGAIDDVIDQHARIFERVRDRDSKGAAEAMRADLLTTEQDLRAALFLNRSSDEGDA